MKKIIITIFGVLLLFMSNNIFSQEEDIRLKSDTILLKTRAGLDKEESPKSYNSDITPEVASLIRSINTPVSYYIGRPDISIPIEEIKLKDYSHLIKLEYNATGNQLRDIPAYAGLGWNMPASGMITRKINGHNDNLLVGSGAGAVIDKSLMDTYNFKINNSDWRAGKFPAIYDYSSLNVFGIYAEPHVREVLSNQTPYLDEFYINVGNIKASFYLYKDNKGELVTKISSQTNLGFKVSDIKSGYDYTDHAISSTEDYLGNKYSTAFSFKIPVKYDMLEITITDNNGVKYIFGGTYNHYDLSLSYSIGPHSSQDGQYRSGYPMYYDRNGNVYPGYAGKVSPHMFDGSMPGTITSWRLKEIITTKGEWIKFDYKRFDNIMINNILEYQQWEDIDWDRPLVDDPVSAYHDTHKFRFIYPTYLSAISSSNGARIDFSYEKRNDLWKYVYDPDKKGKEFMFNIFKGLMDNVGAQRHIFHKNNQELKLTQIKLSKLDKIYNLKYIENPNERLKLSQLQLVDSKNNSSLKYDFVYNTLKLPAYTSNEYDNWGFYNGKDFTTYFLNNLLQNDFYEKYPSEANKMLYDYKSPDPTKAKAEVLESITHPTGGKTLFEYELHDYNKISSVCKPYTPLPGNAGGLRIKRITTVPADRQPNILKDYKYKNESGISSGFLSYIPAYVYLGWRRDADNNYLKKYHYNMYVGISPQKEDTHITYTQVEETTNNIKTIYKYIGFNEVEDILPVTYSGELTRDPVWQDGRPLAIPEFSSRKIDRGLLKSVEYYSSDNKMVKKDEFSYNTSTSEFIESIHPGSNEYQKCLFKIYTHYPYLTKEIVTDYTSSGNIENVTEYQYDKNRLITELKQKNSEQGFLITKYKYPSDFQTQEPYKTMIEKNILSPVIHEESTLNGFLSVKYTDYAVWGNYVLPSSYRLQIGNNSPETRIVYNRYDQYGNPVAITEGLSDEIVILWSYYGSYPVAEIRNSSYSQVLNALTSTVIGSVENLAKSGTSNKSALDKLREHTLLKNAHITTYKYEPPVGVTEITDAKGIATYYSYDSSGRLKRVYKKVNDEEIPLELHNYNYRNK